MKARLPLIAAMAVALAPLDASAQAWLGSPDFSEGAGIRAGNLELHPSIGAEFGYDSNFTRASAAEGPVDVMKLRVTPSLTLSSLGRARRNTDTPPNVAFAASAYASYFELFPLDSEDSEVRKRRNVSAGVDTKVDVFPHRKVGFDLMAGWRRVIEVEGRSEDLAGEGFNRGTFRYGAGVTWRPGGGLFEWRGGYTGTFNYFENDSFDSLQNLHHDVNTRGRWRFLPRSAVLFDTSYTFIRYTNANTSQTDGDILRSRIGFHGLVTYHLALLGMVGWASTFYKAHAGSIVPRQYDSIIANAEVRWFIQPRPNLETATIATGLSSMALGYTRSVNNSYLGSFYSRDRGYLQFSAFLLGAIAGGLEFGVSRVSFPAAVGGNVNTPAIDQLRLDGRVFGEYRFTETIAANATFLYDHVMSDAVPNDDLDYRRWQAYLGLRWFM
ncbi:MAG: hypothetical protein EOO73_25990 [Myxococcales bacterium]|nr:MAG: hypothetical protein EOO73_25990 [Myxococcales bacterium]